MIQTAYDISGPKDAPALVLLHAASYTRKMWLPQVQALKKQFRVISLDLPGHGRLAETPFQFATAVRIVRDVLAQEVDHPVLLVGASLGGCVAMHFAGCYPDNVAGLIVSGSTFDTRGPLCRLVLTGEIFIFPAGATFFERSFFRDMRNRHPATAEEMIAAGVYWHGAADAVKVMRGMDFRAKLSRYPGPTLILNGVRDWVHRTAEKAFAQSAQNARIQIIPGASHMANLDQPEIVTEAIRAFAISLPAKAGRLLSPSAGVSPASLI